MCVYFPIAGHTDTVICPGEAPAPRRQDVWSRGAAQWSPESARQPCVGCRMTTNVFTPSRQQIPAAGETRVLTPEPSPPRGQTRPDPGAGVVRGGCLPFCGRVRGVPPALGVRGGESEVLSSVSRSSKFTAEAGWAERPGTTRLVLAAEVRGIVVGGALHLQVTASGGSWWGSLAGVAWRGVPTL